MTSITTALRAAATIAAVAALAGCGGAATPEPPPETTNPVGETTTTPVEETSESFDPVAGDPAPPLPESFGSWTRDGGSGGANAYYVEADTGASIDAGALVYITKEEAQLDIPSVAIGDFLCGEDPEVAGFLSCSTNAWNGALQVISFDLTPEELVAAGNELLAAWT